MEIVTSPTKKKYVSVFVFCLSLVSAAADELWLAFLCAGPQRRSFPTTLALPPTSSKIVLCKRSYLGNLLLVSFSNAFECL